MLGFGPIATMPIGSATMTAQTGGGGTVQVTVTSAAGRANGAASCAAVAEIIIAAMGRASGSSTVSGHTSVVTRSATASDHLIINYLGNPYLVQFVVTEPKYGIQFSMTEPKYGIQII